MLKTEPLQTIEAAEDSKMEHSVDPIFNPQIDKIPIPSLKKYRSKHSVPKRRTRKTNSTISGMSK
jgi:hypothetical protein